MKLNCCLCRYFVQREEKPRVGMCSRAASDRFNQTVLLLDECEYSNPKEQDWPRLPGEPRWGKARY